MREVTVQDMKDYLIGSAIFSNGQSERWAKSNVLIEQVQKRGLKPRLVDPKDIPNDALICSVGQRAGGGYKWAPGELDMLLGPYKEAADKRDWSCYARSIERANRELAKLLKPEEIYAYLHGPCSSSQGIVGMFVSGVMEKPLVDGDSAGTAMSPHLTMIAKLKTRPISVGVSPFGEVMILMDTARGRVFTERMHYASGCWFVANAGGLAPWRDYVKCTVKNQDSRLIKVGAAVREAREKGRDPIAAFMKAAPAHKLFEGVVEKFTLEKVGGFAQGNYYMKGAGDFKGHRFRVYYNMENRISWLDDKLYVTIPDINATVDSKTCENLPVLDHDGVRIVPGIYDGKEATVLGIANDKIWYELPGAIDGVHRQLKDYGFPDIRHRPIKEVLGAR